MNQNINAIKEAVEAARQALEAPAFIHFDKEEGSGRDINIKFQGSDIALASGLRMLVKEIIRELSNKSMQKNVLELLYEDTMQELGLDEE